LVASVICPMMHRDRDPQASRRCKFFCRQIKDVGVAAFQQNVNQTEEFVEQCHHIAIAASFACLEGNSESEW